MLIEYPHGSRVDKDFFHLGSLTTVFQAEVFAISQTAEKLYMEEITNHLIVILSDSQAAIKAIKCNVVRSGTVLRCIEILNRLGKNNRIILTWIPGHQGVYGNETADTLAKQGSEMPLEGPEPFIPVPYATCLRVLRNWTIERWKTSWNDGKDCLRTKKYVGWASDKLRKNFLP